MLPNPEREWERPAGTTGLDRGDVERRIGATHDPLELLSGGLANTNIRIGADRVLRIYRRDPRAKGIEATLLRRSWRHLIVPAVRAEGEDFLLLDHVAHTPLEPEHGAAIGRALAEIHESRHERAGLFGPGLDVTEPFTDWFADFVAHATPVAAFLRQHEDVLRRAAGTPVLLHGDFKASNLHWAVAGAPLVLDWEFAYAGPALMDVGQLVRWDPPSGFVDAFAASYRAAGGELPDQWRRLASAFDLVNLAGLLAGAKPGSRRERDVRARIGRTLADFSGAL